MDDAVAHTEHGTQENADVVSLLLAVFGAGFLLFAALFNEFLLQLIDPQPPLSRVVVSTVRTDQVATFIIGLALIGGALVVSKVPRLNAVARMGVVSNTVVALLLGISSIIALEFLLRPLAAFYIADSPRIYMRDGELGWRLRPNVRWSHGHRMVSINSFGLRGPEFTVAKPDRVIRILFLGDSATFGENLDTYAEAFPFRVEEILAAKTGNSVEAINAGVSGYSTWQEYAFLKREGVAYNPDIVVLSFVLNDVIEWRRLKRFGGLDEGDIVLRTSAGLPLADKSAILYLLWKLWVGIAYDSNPTYRATVGEYYNVRALCRDELTPERKQAWSVTLGYLGKIHELCRSRGIPFLLVLLPAKFQVENPEQRAQPQARLRAYAAKNGIPTIDMLPILERRMSERGLTTGNLYFRYDDFDFTKTGNRIIAEAAAQFLLQQGLAGRDRAKESVVP